MLLLLLALAAQAQAPEPGADPAWAVATSRVLGAAGTVRDRAWRLAGTAEAVAAAGRAGAASSLASDARELHQAVVSARLAAQVMSEQVGAPAAP